MPKSQNRIIHSLACQSYDQTIAPKFMARKNFSSLLSLLLEGANYYTLFLEMLFRTAAVRCSAGRGAA